MQDLCDLQELDELDRDILTRLQCCNEEEIHVGDLGRRVELFPQELGQEVVVLVLRRTDHVRNELGLLRLWGGDTLADWHLRTMSTAQNACLRL